MAAVRFGAGKRRPLDVAQAHFNKAQGAMNKRLYDSSGGIVCPRVGASTADSRRKKVPAVVL
jgi:hypothetical protein